jgi:hypothetical protein
MFATHAQADYVTRNTDEEYIKALSSDDIALKESILITINLRFSYSQDSEAIEYSLPLSRTNERSETSALHH